MIVKVDTDNLKALSVEGSDIVFTPKAEKALVALLTLQKQVDEAIKKAKAIIEATALEYNPNFTSVQGDEVKVGYRTYGSKYSIDKDHTDYLDKLPEGLVEKKTSYSLNTKEIDKFVEEHEALPVGINANPRGKQISIKLLKEFEDAS